MMRSLILLLVSIATFASMPSPSEKLEHVSIVFRHGDRAPFFTYPYSAYQESSWPQGFSQLSIEGMKQSYFLGTLLRKRYIDTGFLARNYTRSQVDMISTSRDRTLMSASTLLAGQFPPGPNQTFESGLNWQPIPIYSIPSESILLTHSPSGPDCNTYQRLINNDRDILLRIQIEHQTFFDQLKEYTGMPEVDVFNVGFLADTLFVEYTNNLTMPSWFNVTILRKLELITDQIIYLLTNTNEKRRLTGGVWANEVMGNMEKKASGRLMNNKLTLYSAHDITVAAMLSVFGLYDGIRPSYSSAFVIELYSLSSDYYVRFFYKNQPWSERFIPLVHPKCRARHDSCSLNELKQIMNQYRLTESQWNEVCDGIV